MDARVTDLSDVEKELIIDVPADELVPHFDEAYKRQMQKIEIKGFRKGKAPLSLVKKIYGESIEYNSLDIIATDIFKKIVQERSIQPIGSPVLSDMDYKRGDKLTFKVKYEVKPIIDVKDYKGIQIERMLHRVTDREKATVRPRLLKK